ncbi:DUF1552 domain-containing protein [soil metagenome]
MSTLHRRHFLRGLGALVSLPALEAFAPARSLAANGAPALATTATGAPLRMAYLYVPNGVNVERWMPVGTGRDYQLSPTLQPLAPHRDDFQFVHGLAQDNARGGKDGAGDHARASATFLTGARPKKTAGSDIQLGISADQVAANAIGHLTRLSSLELSCDGVRKSGGCDSGYSCAYQFNLSWRSATTPMTPEASPRLLFERLFGSGSPEERNRAYRLRQQQQRSILDFVMEDTKFLNHQLGRNDQQKVEEYLTGVRELEQRIEKVERFGDLPDPGQPAPEPGIPGSYREHLSLMFDVLALAFETDSTRIATFLLAHDGSNRSFNEIGVSDGHHNISHHQEDKDKLAKIAKIDMFYAEAFAGFLETLKKKQDVDGNSLLHNSMIVYGSAIRDGNRHSHDQLPVILAGNGGGTLDPGRVNGDGQNVPMTNLYLSMLDRMGINPERIGDSTGLLAGI